MGHLSPKKYIELQKRLDQSVQGVPKSENLFKILQVMFSEQEAEQISKLPLTFFTVQQAMKIFKKSEKETLRILDHLADKGFLFDLEGRGTKAYFVSPPIPGFFELALMRTGGIFDKRILSELFYEYLEEDDLLKSMMENNPATGRVFAQEKALPNDKKTEILDYERVSKIIETAKEVSVGVCYCRHKNEHLGRSCNNPQRTCLSFNKLAKSLIKHKIAEKITKEEAKNIVDESIKLGLIQTGDNVQNEVNVICNCCSCCCELLDAYKRFGYTDNFTSNFICKSGSDCVGCGVCVNKCPVGAQTLIKDKLNQKVKIDTSKCIGCGVCVNFCSKNNLLLIRKKDIKIVPKDTFERIIIQAINAGKLQNYIFDNQNSLNHEILRKFLKVIFSLTPTRFVVANKQLRSRFLNNIAKTKKYELFKEIYDIKNRNYDHEELKKLK